MTTKTNPSILIVKANKLLSPEKMHPLDLCVEEETRISISEEDLLGDVHTYALDVFHQTTPVKVLDDFEFKVFLDDVELFPSEDENDKEAAFSESLKGRSEDFLIVNYMPNKKPNTLRVPRSKNKSKKL